MKRSFELFNKNMLNFIIVIQILAAKTDAEKSDYHHRYRHNFLSTVFYGLKLQYSNSNDPWRNIY